MASSLIGSSTPVSPAPVEGIAFTGLVAKFADADHNTDPSLYAASISWGDGQASRGTITADPGGGFDVIGTHAYAKDGPYRLTAQVGDADGDVVSISTTNIVAQAPISATAGTIQATRNGLVNRATVATFTDADPALRASAFSATIDWGDGSTTSGMIVPDRAGPGFRVLGSHRYTAPGSYTVSASIRQGGVGPLAYFTESDLISDGAVAADHINPSLVNPWGLAAPNPADFWDGNNGSGTSSVFSGSGDPSAGLPVVTIPPPAGGTAPSSPTGVVFNATPGFVVTDGTNSGAAAFLFATEDGTIAGWSPRVGTGGANPPSVHAVLAVDNSASGAVYKGLASLAVPAGGPLSAGQYLFATNFHSGDLDVFDSAFRPVTLPAGAFADPSLPAGFAPFGVQTVGADLYVTYARQDAAKHDDVAGPGNGYVDVYSTSGTLLRRLGGTTTQFELNSPWGVTVAPASFGPFSGDILVGNFGNSRISAFDPVTGAFLGQLSDAQGRPLVLDGGSSGPDSKGLWGTFAFPGGTGAAASTLYFSSGFNDEADGLFGTLTPTFVATASASSGLTVGH